MLGSKERPRSRAPHGERAKPERVHGVAHGLDALWYNPRPKRSGERSGMSHARTTVSNTPSSEVSASRRSPAPERVAAEGFEAEAPAFSRLAALQRTAGNQAVQRMLRGGGTATGHRLPAVAPRLQRHDGPTVLSPEGEDKGKAKAAEKTPEAKKMEDIRAILDKSPVGKAALAILDKYKVPVDLAYPGPGSVYQPPAPGKIKILATKTVEQAAFTLVHEANHAEASNQSKTADINKLGRAEYVKSMLDEETTSTVNAILSKTGMSADDQKGVKSAPLLQARYEKAKKAALDAKKSAEEAEKAAWQSIRDAFTDGTLVTSNTKEAYDVYYGKAWDKLHKPPAKEEL